MLFYNIKHVYTQIKVPCYFFLLYQTFIYKNIGLYLIWDIFLLYQTCIDTNLFVYVICDIRLFYQTCIYTNNYVYMICYVFYYIKHVSTQI